MKLKNEVSEYVGTVNVNSGEVVLIDACEVLSVDEFKDNVVKTQPVKFKNGLLASGFGGDGNFPVFVKRNEKGLITEMNIKFHVETEDGEDVEN